MASRDSPSTRAVRKSARSLTKGRAAALLSLSSLATEVRRPSAGSSRMLERLASCSRFACEGQHLCVYPRFDDASVRGTPGLSQTHDGHLCLMQGQVLNGVLRPLCTCPATWALLARGC